MSEPARKLRPYEVPPSLRKTLKKGEYAVYRLLGVEWRGDKFVGRTAGLPATDTVLDPSGELHSIGFVQSYDNEGRAILGDLRFAVENLCQIILHSGAKDANQYAFMEASNFNRSNPLRDTSIAPSFERVDNMTHAVDDRKFRAQKLEAVALASSLTDEEVVDFVRSNLNQPDTKLQLHSLPNGELDIEQIRNSVEALAERRPDVLLKMSVKLPESESDATLEQELDAAVTNQIIKFDRETKQWYNGTSGKPFFKVLSIKNGVPKKELFAWLKTKEGNKIRIQLSEANAAEPVSNEK